VSQLRRPWHYRKPRPEGGGSDVLRNVGILLHNYTES
jgi:hypothetical protein